MNWENLYSNHRLGSRNLNAATETRGHYIRDYDKVIFSSHFRRLQNKTQVFPLPGPIFVHNRLTHSLEVASVGRSLARVVGEKLSQKYLNHWSKSTSDFYKFELSDVIQTACLSHDIGNPPYGHFGEEAIKDFFKNLFAQADYGLSKSQIADFEKFEGNANAFRILSTLFQNQGLKLTYTTIASIIKYPVNASAGFNKASGQLGLKKSGYFENERKFFTEILEALGVPKLSEDHFARHPFVFLVEAADDICYRIIDLEDALRLKIISFDSCEKLLMPFFDEDSWRPFILEQLSSTENEQQKLALLRAMLINKLSEKCAQVFLDHEQELLDGSLNKSLVDLLEPQNVALLHEIDSFSVKYIYNSEQVIERELAGYKVIQVLLQAFVNARLHPDLPKSKKLANLLPFKYSDDLYIDFLQILDFVSDMTDEQSLIFSQKLA
jgi:dGTPase